MRESPSFLQTKRLTFRTWRPDDRDLAIALWTDPAVARFIVAGGVFSREAALARLGREIDNERRHGYQYWPLFLTESGDHVGCCGLKPYSASERVLEFGVQLLPAFWGRGLAVEAGRAVVGLAFEKFSVAWLFAGHHPQNEASRAMLTKLGFVYTHHEIYEPTGLEHPSYRLVAT